MPARTPPARRPQQHRLTYPLTADQVESLDAMLETLFRATSNPQLLVPPTRDPHIVGAIWNNAGVLTLSAG